MLVTGQYCHFVWFTLKTQVEAPDATNPAGFGVLLANAQKSTLSEPGD
jgi:hypothetical protein